MSQRSSDTTNAPIESDLPSVSQTLRRGFWLRTMIQWHWISSAVCLLGMILFSVTGITLNHASQIETVPDVEHEIIELPQSVIDAIDAESSEDDAPLPVAVAGWLNDQLGVSVGSRKAEWSEDEIYLSMPGPGSDAWLSIDRFAGEVEFERTQRGWISYFNDLHKGRNTGPAWSWFIDIFALATLVFCFTGLGLLFLHARHRRMTWPLVGLGLIVPLLLALLLIH
nr:PepSY-associated TM helix domain-containing protein [Rosistilla ulvae]